MVNGATRKEAVAPMIDDVAFAVDTARLGLAAIDAGLVVRERRGQLARWLPEVGRPCAETGLLFAMEPSLEALRELGAPALILPSVGFENGSGERVNVSISWNPETSRYVVVIAPDEGAKQLDRLLIQQRRERWVLQQQASAAADRLRVSMTLYRDIVEATDDAVLRFGPDLALSFVNGPAAALIGVGADVAIGRQACAVLPLPVRENPWRADMCATGPASFEQPLLAPEGAMRWLWWNVRWLGDDAGPREFQAVGRDVTELRRLRVEAERASEEARFAALAEERLRIAHDLHDTFVHSLVSTMARLSLLRRAAPEGTLKSELAEAEREARLGLRAAREAVGAIRYAEDFPEGAAPALIEAANALGMMMEVRLELDSDLPALTRPQTLAILRVGREALRNVERHSGAREVTLSLRRREGEVVLEVADDGVGFNAGQGPSGHYGLIGMREQARFAGGTIDLGLSPRGGARVTLTIPTR
jgi:PAS domain S-box-containing protein